ncbi:hypothetical protein G5B37_03830 [Rasiella rasia]|uniref:Uncharacterized protein n=1 Tax=Rasiella rasia TaxID=2744027 RepID=A0A6G6GLZ9_9FLAO|nr:hypothetical protein [Rasiella rasia]QIE58721.1 hypothetical protein G5B37_03830 [Rasiella rasia]
MKLTLKILFLFVTFQLSSQEFELWGTVRNDLNIAIEKADIENLRTNELSSSDCNGNFKLKVIIGDTLKISKGHFMNGSSKVVSHERIDINLEFDRKKIRETFTRVMDNRYQDPSEEKKKLIISGRSAVTLIKDYNFEKGSITEVYGINPLVIDTLVTLRNDYAIDLLGEWGKGGVVWLFTECEK